MDISGKTKQSLGWFTTLPLGLHFLRFANSIILARILLPHDFGIVGLATVLMYYANSLTSFGFANAIIQRVDIKMEHFDSFFSFNLLVSGFLYMVFYLSAPNIALFFHEPDLCLAIELISLIFLISALLVVPLTRLKRDINFRIIAIAEAIKVVTSMAISLTLALYGYKYLSIIYAMVISGLISMTIIRLSCDFKPKFILNFCHLKDLLSFSMWNFALGQLKMLSDNIDKLFIGKTLTTTELGYFDKASGLAKMPYEQFSNRLSTVSFSAFSRVQSNNSEQKNYIVKLMVLNSFICFPLLTGLAAVSEAFTLVLLGEKWREMIPVLSVLSISFLFASISGPIMAMNIAIGHIKKQAIVRLFAFVFLVFLLSLGVSLGIVIISFCILIFNIALFSGSFYVLVRSSRIKSKDLWFSVKPAIQASIIMLIVVVGSTQYLFQRELLLNLLTSVFLGAATYLLCLYFIPFSQWKFIRNKMHEGILRIKRFITLSSID
jgi:teichuronic acid exporter